jgi:FHA domain
MGRDEFSASLDGCKLLLIRLDGDPATVNSVRRAFAECPTDHGYTWMPRSEPTATITGITRLSAAEMEALSDQVFLTPDGASLARILRQTHYVLPLRKRVESTVGDAERISVGRSHSCDIVVFHPTVSKLHAWLEHDENDRVYVSDARSMNLTRVRGRIIASEDLVNVGYCDEICFGEVSLRICTPQILWDALSGMAALEAKSAAP